MLFLSSSESALKTKALAFLILRLSGRLISRRGNVDTIFGGDAAETL